MQLSTVQYTCELGDIYAGECTDTRGVEVPRLQFVPTRAGWKSSGIAPTYERTQSTGKARVCYSVHQVRT